MTTCDAAPMRGTGTVAWVDDEPIGVSEVDDRERATRLGPASPALPSPDSSEGRQLRRWLVQVLAAERVVAAEANRRGVSSTVAPSLTEIASDGPALLELGSVAAALLAESQLARALFLTITDHVGVTPDQIASYYTSNKEQFQVREHRVIRHLVMPTAGPAPDLAGRPPRTVHRGELVGVVEDAVFAAAPGTVVGPVRDPLGWHVVLVDAARPARMPTLSEVHDQIAHRLLGSARRRAFTVWLDRERAELVRLAPGFEHPGDPSQPDNTHRH